MLKLSKIHHSHKLEPIWHIQIALMVTIILQFALDSDLAFGSRYLIAGAEVLFMGLLILIRPKEKPSIIHLRRFLALLLIIVISYTNLTSLLLVITNLFSADATDGKSLILSAVSIYITNIIVFSLWYWELDSDGLSDSKNPDFLFPQMQPYKLADNHDWSPTYLDYLFYSTTTATNFSPSDTAPLSHRAKALTATQIVISLVTVALVLARAVNTLV